jgi:ATP-binding cassette, subfamily B, multidrug efflux pump
LASGERIIEVLDTNEIIAEPDNSERFESFNDSIEFKNVKFSYDDSKTVLSDLSFKINKGEKIAIVGATGSGKTSIINILLKLYEFNSGCILIDGKDIRQIDRKDLLKRFALVMQDVFLFSRSINDNISLGREHIDESDVNQAISEIGALDFISALQDNTSSMLNERGNSLSTGQKQLISFSRAYTGKPDILVLDEATSNIDSETERQIEVATDKLLENKTAIIIAHRLSTVRKADRIIVLHNGEIREMGTHRELLDKNGLYAKLYKLQFEAMEK